jgi:hypothetical protein
VDGEPVVIDPGTWTYAAGHERDLLRSTPAHATVAIDGRSQFEPWGAFRTGPLPRVELAGVTEREATALVRWPGEVVHRRRIRWEDDAILVSEGEYEVERGLRSELLFSRGEGDVLVRRTHGALPLTFEWRIRR